MINLNGKGDEFDKRVHKLALELKNPRQTPEEQADTVMLPRYKYTRNFHKRCHTGGALSFMEAKHLVREQLTFELWKISFYEVIQFPQVRFFETEEEARKYWKRIKSAQTLNAQKASLAKPSDHIYGERLVEEEYQVEGYKPDPMGVRF